MAVALDKKRFGLCVSNIRARQDLAAIRFNSSAQLSATTISFERCV